MSEVKTFKHTDSVNGKVSEFRATIEEKSDRKVHLRLVDPFDVHWKPGDRVIFCRKHESLTFADGSPIWS